MKVFVAGSSGLVGSAIVRNSPQIHEVFQTARKSLDLTDREAIREFLLVNNIDAVVIAAAKVGGIIANSTHQLEFLLENLKIQNAILEASIDAKVQNLVFLGSSCIYPKLAPQPISETHILTGPLEPTNEGYALAKIAGVRLCKAVADELGYNYFSLMPTNLYGPNDNFDLINSHVPAALMRRMHEAKISDSKSVKIWGTGVSKREFMHVDDLANAVWHFLKLEPKGELINIGTGKDLSIKHFANLMVQVTGYKGEIEFDSSKPDGAPQKLLDTSKATRLGWQSRIELSQGLAATYSWFVEHIAKGDIRGY
jgi:GDP-L-fucose synthase